jgi:hypothetical protein
LLAKPTDHRARGDPIETGDPKGKTDRLDTLAADLMAAVAPAAEAALIVVSGVATGVHHCVSGPRHRLYPRSPLLLFPMTKASILSPARFA